MVVVNRIYDPNVMKDFVGIKVLSNDTPSSNNDTIGTDFNKDGFNDIIYVNKTTVATQASFLNAFN